MLRKTLILFPILFSLTVGTAYAAYKIKASDAMDYRQGVFHAIAWNFGSMAAMLKGEIAFDQNQFARSALRIEQLSHMPLEGFIPDSTGWGSDAKAAIWSNWDDFKAKMEEFQRNSVDLTKTANAGQREAIAAAFTKTAESCKGCHDKYKK